MIEEKPFIHLLESPNAKYFFDVNTNEIVYVDDKGYDLLKKVLAEEKVVLTDEEEGRISKLKSDGYLSNHRVKSIKHPVTDFLELNLTRRLSKITLQLTQDCNLRCSYCGYTNGDSIKQRPHSTKTMTFELAKKGINFLLEHSMDSKMVDIGLYGGEPLLEFDLIKRIVAYAEEAAPDKEVTFSLTTNGTLITEEIIEYFIKHNLIIVISLDGPREVHDSNRVFADNGSGSFDKVMETLKQINDKHPNYAKKLIINMVIDPKHSYDNITSLFKEYDFLEEMLIMPTIIDDSWLTVKNTYSEEFIIESEYKTFLSFLNYFNRIEDTYISPLNKKEIFDIDFKKEKFTPSMRLPDQAAPGGPCIPGQMRLFMDTDGNFLPCERVNELSEIMKMGNIEKGFFIDKAEKLLNIGALTPDECRNCFAFNHCSLCVKYTDDNKCLSGELKLLQCDSVRNRFAEELHSFIIIDEFQDFYHQTY